MKTIRGTLFIVAAPSGAGKSSLVNAVLAKEPGIALSISFTSRAPRPGERHAQHYHFVTKPEFEATIRSVFALDATKFGRKALSLTAPFGPRMTIVTDTRPAPTVICAIQTAGATLTLTREKLQDPSSRLQGNSNSQSPRRASPN